MKAKPPSGWSEELVCVIDELNYDFHSQIT
jgi:hypothetical protein